MKRELSPVALHELRKLKGLSLQKLADQAGMAKSTIIELEKSPKKPSATMHLVQDRSYEALKKALGATDAQMRGEELGPGSAVQDDAAIDAYKKKLADTKPVLATRKSSEDALEVINGVVAETLGGSADLTGSNNTKTSQTKSITPTDFSGRYIHYGIREHGMAAAMNGIALHGGLIPYSGGFLIFSDYCRPSIRLAALMGVRTVNIHKKTVRRPPTSPPTKMARKLSPRCSRCISSLGCGDVMPALSSRARDSTLSG